MSSFLPALITNVKAPPIKCQGIKTKLLPFIGQKIYWNGTGRWIEPFLGSGVVLFNVCPRKAIVSDSNRYLIQFYKDIQKDRITESKVRSYLKDMGAKLEMKGEDFYYEVRDQFNREGGSLEFLFLNRSCFNGLMRFSSKGNFNVPFGHKPKRFSQAYVTKITNQVAWARKIIKANDWEFIVSDFRDTLTLANSADFVYLDPPYIGRHTDYYNSWSEKDAIDMCVFVKNLPCGYAISMWKENKYRSNNHILTHWDGEIIEAFNHFYHVGATENLRNEIVEALIIRKGFSANGHSYLKTIQSDQLSILQSPV